MANTSKFTTLAHLKQLAQIVKTNDDALAAQIEAAIAEIEGKGYQNAEQVSAAVSAAIAALNIGQYAKAADLEALVQEVEGLVTAGGEPNVIEVVKVNGTALSVKDKAVDVVVPEYSIVKAANSGDYAAVYNLTKGGTIVGASINIPKDMMVKSGSVVGNEIVLVLNDEAATEIKIPVGSLIEYVTSGSATGDMVVVSVSADHKVTATITDGSITLSKLASSVQTAIGKAHEHGNKTVLDGITSTQIAAWGAAEGNAKTYADGLNTAMDTRVKVVEGKAHEHSNKALLDTYTQTEANLADAVSKKHSHTNKTVLDGIDSAKIGAWDQAVSDIGTVKGDYLKGSDKTALEKAISDGDAAALASAKSYADGLAKNYDASGAAATAESNAKTYAKNYADGLAGNYDAKGAAAQALVDAKAYADGMVASDADVTAMLNEVFGE